MKKKKKLTKASNLVAATLGAFLIGFAIPNVSSGFGVSSETPVSASTTSDQTSIVAKDITIHVGDKWTLGDGVTLTDKDGNHPDLYAGGFGGSHPYNLIDGGVQKIPGVYRVDYQYAGINVTAHVTVLPLVTLTAKDSTIYTGSKWTPADNFTGGTVDGKALDFAQVKVSGTVDTTKAGVYPITYAYEDQSKTVNVTVKKDQTSIVAKDITIHVGDKWTLGDGVTLTDKDGNHPDLYAGGFGGSHPYNLIDGGVQKIPGVYRIDYHYAGITVTAYLMVDYHDAGITITPNHTVVQ